MIIGALCLFLAVLNVCLQFVIVECAGHTHSHVLLHVNNSNSMLYLFFGEFDWSMVKSNPFLHSIKKLMRMNIRYLP